MPRTRKKHDRISLNQARPAWGERGDGARASQRCTINRAPTKGRQRTNEAKREDVEKKGEKEEGE